MSQGEVYPCGWVEPNGTPTKGLVKQGSTRRVDGGYQLCHVLHLLEDEQIVLQRMNELLKPGGLLISATPCVGEKMVLKNLLLFAGRVGLMPNIRSFKIRNLVDTIEEGNFSIVESNCLKKSSQEYFIIARKN
ncbi:hypothetical protein NBRC13296_26630 [Paenibacillus chitinolyticus]|uniref:hypothetical protein n=1 Tax=Paenibacillus chitinolyticus TaxID=79263 RepID=UPI0035591D32